MTLKRYLVAFFLIFCFKNYGYNFFVTSVPKSGTHLAGKLLKLLTKGVFERHSTDWIRLEESQVCAIPRDGFLIGHAIPSQENITLLNLYNLKGVFIYRDPRDQLVSNMFFSKQRSDAWPELAKLEQDELLTKLIKDASSIYGPPKWRDTLLLELKGVDTLFNLYLPWRHCPLVYATTFESLVGAAGGGNDLVQFNEISAIVKHLGLSLSKDEMKVVASRLFGTREIFRSGQIGEWKKYFKTFHKKLFKKVAGTLLIELGYESGFDW